jgi:hypothetical protein
MVFLYPADGHRMLLRQEREAFALMCRRLSGNPHHSDMQMHCRKRRDNSQCSKTARYFDHIVGARAKGFRQIQIDAFFRSSTPFAHERGD